MKSTGNTCYHRLPNGLRVVHRQTQLPVSYMGIMIGAGTRDEEVHESGLAHFIEHCVFKGTERWSARELLRRVEDVGGELNAYTTKEETVFYAAVPTRYAARTIEVLSQMVLHPVFPTEEVEKEKQVIAEEIESYNDSPSELIYDDFESVVFAGHPLSQPILGTKRSLRALNKKKAQRFMEERYLPDRMVFFSVSALPAARVLYALEKYWQPESTGGSGVTCLSPTGRTVPGSGVAGEMNMRRHTHQAHVMLGGRAYPIGHERQLAMYLLNNLLGGDSLSSRLNLSLREQRGLVYTIESTYTPLSDTGYWSVYFATDESERELCEELVRKELRKLQLSALTESALQRAKCQLQGQMAVSAMNMENNALAMGKLMLYHNVAPTWEETYSRIEQLSREELWECAQEVFDERNISILRYV